MCSKSGVCCVMSSSSSVVVGVRQLLLVNGPRVGLVRVRTGGNNNKASPSSNVTKYTTEPCRICTHRSNDNEVLSDDRHQILKTLLEGTDDDERWTLCALCLSLVERLTRLTEEVEDIKVRIKVVMKMTGSTTPKDPGGGGIQAVVGQNDDTVSNDDKLQLLEEHVVGGEANVVQSCEDEDDKDVCEGVSSFEEDDAPFVCVPDEFSRLKSSDDDDVKMTCVTEDQGGEGDGNQEDKDTHIPSPIQSDPLEAFVRVHNTRASTKLRCGGKVPPTQATLSNHKTGQHSSGYRSVCRICKIRFRSSHVFNAHIHLDPEEDPDRVEYNCACGMSYESRNQYESHWRKTHKQKKRGSGNPHMILPCYFCGRRMRLRNLGDHMRRHTLERPYLCTTCGNDYVNSKGLRRHTCGAVKAISNGRSSTLKPAHCHICGKVFANSQTLSGHIRSIHKSKKERSMHDRGRKRCGTCYFCGRRMRLGSIGHHMRRHTLERPYLCTTCGKDYVTSGYLRQHRCARRAKVRSKDRSSTLKSDQCHICGKVYADSQILREHIRSIHKSKKVTLTLTPMKNKSFKCPECGKPFRHRESLKNHLKRVHLLDITDKQQCDICSKNFNSADVFKAHTHPDPSDPTKVVFSCSICQKTFGNSNRYRTHMTSTHNGVKKQCDHCGKLFKYNSGLQFHSISCHLPLEEARKCTFDSCREVFPTLNERLDHERVVHKGMSSTKCFFCSKTFPSPHKLEAHLRIHTGERPFFCEKCGRDFPTSKYLKIHMDLVCGGDEWKREEARRRKREDVRAFRAKLKYPCHLCDKRFGQKPQLVSHRKREHFI